MNTSNIKLVLLSFLPNILIGFIIELLENQYGDQSHFKSENFYFKQLYNNKLITLGIFILLLKYIKMISSYIIVFICFLFNIMLSVSDNSNIYTFLISKKEYEKELFYRNLNNRVYINYFFIIVWTILFIIKLLSWYRKIFRKNESDFNSEQHTHNE